MSGPKVIRIRTREELEAICARLIAVYDSAANDLRRVLARSGALSAETEAELKSTRDAFGRLLKEGRFSDLQRQVTARIVFLQSEVARQEQLAIATAGRTRARRQQVTDAAASVADALRAAQLDVPPELEQVGKRAKGASDTTLGELQGIVDTAFRQLTRKVAPTTPAASTELAGRLALGLAPVQTLAEWLAQRPASPSLDPRLVSLLAEMEATGDLQAAAKHTDQLERIERETSPDRRRLLGDSLLLELSESVSQLRRTRASRTRLEAAAAELLTLDDDAARALRTDIMDCLTAGTFAHAEKLLEAAKQTVADVDRRVAATARRTAVLKGLASLGYEIREGMVTAWETDGRVVVSKPGAVDYGIELGAPQDMDRLQMRVVGAERPQTPRTPERDRDQEVIWCSEVDELSRSLADVGDSFAIERALDIGAQPVKTVSSLGSNWHQDDSEHRRRSAREQR